MYNGSSRMYGLLSLLVAELATGPAFSDEIHRFNIDPSDPRAAIREFGRESGVNVIVPGDELEGKHLNAVRGTLSVDDALKRLLAGTGLTYRFGDGGAVVLTAADDRAQESPAPVHSASKKPPLAFRTARDEEVPLLEEIVVTAQKRPENLQDVPVSVTVFSGGDIAARSATRLSDIAQSTPNISWQSVASNDGGAAASVIYSRGVGTNLVGIGAEPGVGLYIDGVYQGRLQGIDVDMLDINRVEVLRGPQGTLYGKNTIGGALNVITDEPDPASDAISGRLDAVTGSFHRADGVANVNIPISDKFAIRVAGSTRRDQGYGHRLLDGQPMADTHRDSGRLSAVFRPNDEWDVLASIDATHIRQHDADFGLPAVGNPALTKLYNSRFTPTYDSQWIPREGYDSYATGPNTDDALLWGGAVTTTWHAGVFDVKSISAFRHNSTTVGLDPDGSPLDVLGTLTTIGQNQFSQELQASGSAFDDRLKWVSGLYYFDESANEEESANVYPMLLPLVGDLGFFRLTTISNHDYASYAQGTYALLDPLHLTLGARYTAENKSATYYQRALTTGAVQNPLTGESAHFHDVSPRVAADYQWTSDLMTYASAAKGFKSGGFNNISIANAYGPEHVWTYETGLRSDWMAKRLRLNLSAYYSKYSDIQVSEVYATPGGKPQNLVANAATADIKGGELELTALIATGLSVSLNGGYTDAAFTSSLNTSGSGLPPVTRGTRFVNVPRWTSALGSEYRVPFASGYDVAMRVDYAYRSRVFHDISGSLATSQPGYGLLKARLIFEPKDGPWSIAAFGTNIANKHFITGGTDFASSLGFVAVVVGPPAEWGFDLRYQL